VSERRLLEHDEKHQLNSHGAYDHRADSFGWTQPISRRPPWQRESSRIS
jgi:hypothetical protein